MSVSLQRLRCHRRLRLLALFGWWLLVLAPMAPQPMPGMPDCHPTPPVAPHACHCPVMSGALLEVTSPAMPPTAPPAPVQALPLARDGVPDRPATPPLRPPAA